MDDDKDDHLLAYGVVVLRPQKITRVVAAWHAASRVRASPRLRACLALPPQVKSSTAASGVDHILISSTAPAPDTGTHSNQS